MAPTEEGKIAAEALKTEANALYARRKYKAAHAKYSEAIKLDDTNAILYANRSACSLELKEFLDAACDAEKATDIDAKYAKAWARLGKASQALGATQRTVDAWEKALECYQDISQLTPAEKQLKASCEEGLKQAKIMLKTRQKPIDNTHFTVIGKSVVDAKLLPWQVAAKMESSKDSIGWSSEFSAGCEHMKNTVVSGKMMSGRADVVTTITNGILRDPRAFFLESSDWFNMYNRQVMMETQFHGGWTTAGPTEAQESALKLQKEKGWEASRPALAITVRAWFMRAFLEENARHDFKTAINFYGSALSVLEWGLKTWKDIPNSDRGAIFFPTFVRGVRRFHLVACHKAYKRDGPRSGIDSDKLDGIAEELIRETLENKPTGNEQYMQDPGFVCSFFAYPAAEAYAIRGDVAMEKGIQYKTSNYELAKDYFAKGEDHYTNAVAALPKDEQNRLLYLKVVLEAAWHQGKPLGMALAYAKDIASSLPAVQKI